MKKRLLCLFLCLVTVLSIVMTGCSSVSDDEANKDIAEEASESAMTLTLWVVSESKVSTGTEEKVEKALNAITETKFKTRLDVRYLTEKEYKEMLDSTIALREEEFASQSYIDDEEDEEDEDTPAVTTEEKTIQEYVTNDLGMQVINYPEPEKNQVDIIYIGDLADENGKLLISGEKFYKEYADKGWLASLDSELTSSSKKISEYVSSTLLSAAKYNGSTYAIPVNNVIGEYTYMLLNKKVMDDYALNGYYLNGEIDSFFCDRVYHYLEGILEVFEKNGATGEWNLTPIASTFEDGTTDTYQALLNMLAYYWNINPETYALDDGFSLFGSYYEDVTTLSRGETQLKFESLFDNDEFVEKYLKLNYYKMNGFIGDVEADEPAAIRFVKGDANILKAYEDDYYPVIVEYPTANVDDIYSNMFAVCYYTEDVERSMEIVTYLNTNAQFRNILQYGVEGVHYKLDNDGRVVRLNNDYQMDVYACGNAFLSLIEANEANPDKWELGKAQNRTALVDPLLGFEFEPVALASGSSVKTVNNGLSLGEKDYAYTVREICNKDILSQDDAIKAWLDACDQAGKSIYMLKTKDVSAQNASYGIYLYNNVGGMNFNLVEEPTYANDGSIKSVDLVMTYTSSESADAYTLSYVRLETWRTFDPSIKYKAEINDVDQTITLTEHTTEAEGMIEFDFYTTENYQIEVYKNLTMPHFLENAVVYKWLGDENGLNFGLGTVKTTRILTYVSDEGEKNVYTYVICRKGFENDKYDFVLDVVPNGTSKDLKLGFAFANTEDAPLNNYVLTYVRVTADKDVKVDYEVTLNGGNDKTFDPAANVTVAPADPAFRLLGMADTEMLKILADLNAELLPVLDSYIEAGDYEQFTKLVAELSKLLSRGVAPFSAGNYPILYRDLKVLQGGMFSSKTSKYCYEGSYGQTVIAQTMDLMTQTSRKTLTDDHGEVLWNGKESYIYYVSPYAIYYQWLNKYGFLPKAGV